MKKNRILSIILAMSLLCSSSLPVLADNLPGDPDEPSETQAVLLSEGSFFSGGQNMNAVLVNSVGKFCYPSSSKTGYWELRGEAREIISQASEIGMDTIFYPVNPQMGSMYHSRYLPQNPALLGNGEPYSLKDPLKTLIKESESNGLSLCAVISPFDLGSISYDEKHHTLRDNHPEWVKQDGDFFYLDPSLPQVWQLIGDLASELTSNYKTNGIVIDFSDCFTRYGASLSDLKNILLAVRDGVRRHSSANKIGVILPQEVMQMFSTEEISSALEVMASESCVDFIMPQISGSVLGDNRYEQELFVWKKLIQEAGAGQIALFPYQDASRVLAPLAESSFYPDSREILFRDFSNQVSDISGSVVDSLGNLLMLPSLYEDMSTPQNASRWYKDPYLEKQPGLVIGQPSDTVSTNQSSYRITGSCDPTQLLYLNGLEYLGAYGEILPSGYFSFLVPLAAGSNSFTFEQGGQKRTVTISRSNFSSENQTPITSILPESAYPASDELISTLSAPSLSCIAPSGAEITAQLGSEVYPLTQQDPSVPKGYPVLYSAPLPLEEKHELEINTLGRVSYTMIYNNQISQQTSEGELIFLGSAQTAAVQISAPLTPVFADESESEILYILPEGTKDSITRSTENHFYLSSGGCIRKNAARILTSTTDLYTMSRKVRNVVIQSTSRGEYITFVNAASVPCAVEYDPEKRVVTLTLSHITQMNDSLNYLQSDMFEDIQVEIEEDKVFVSLTLREEMPFYGYYVSFHENNMIVYFRSHLSEDPRANLSPLQGMNIVIDAGHGGKDLGAEGLLGSQGPDEEALNFAVAEALYDRLDSMGANVFLTRSDHTAMAGLDRVMVAQYREADLFLSIHHCGDQSSGIAVSGNLFAQDLAEQLSDRLSAQLECPAQPVSLTSSYPGEVNLAPALNIDLGNLMNPEDYSRASNLTTIYRTACLLADEIETYVDQSNLQYHSALKLSQQSVTPSAQESADETK